MAFTPVNGLEINSNFITSGTYAPANGVDIYGNFVSSVGVQQRALVVSSGSIRQIIPSEVGTGKKPVVVVSGTVRVRVTSEGSPLIVSQGKFRTLGSTETLIL